MVGGQIVAGGLGGEGGILQLWPRRRGESIGQKIGLPYGRALAGSSVGGGTASSGGTRESTLLKLCCDKALNLLGWQPTLSFMETIDLTAAWYMRYYAGGGGHRCDLTVAQIKAYAAKPAAQRQPWTG